MTWSNIVNSPRLRRIGALLVLTAALAVSSSGAQGDITWRTTRIPNGMVNSPYSAEISAEINSDRVRTFDFSVGSGIPPGLGIFNRTFRVDSTKGTTTVTARLDGTPSVSGNYDFVVGVAITYDWVVEMNTSDHNPQAGDTTATSRMGFALTIAPEFTIKSPDSLPDGDIGRQYGPVQFSSTWDDNRDISIYWAISGGTLPPGLGLSKNGSLEGAPKTAGSYSFSVEATATNSLFVWQTRRRYSLIVTEPFSITSPTALPDGRERQDYSTVQFRSSWDSRKDIDRITWGVSGGTLPPGLRLGSTGGLAGTPAAEGSYSFTVEAKAQRLAVSYVGYYTVASTTRRYSLRILPHVEIHTLSPSEIPQGSREFALNVNGEGFTPTSTIQWNGRGLQTSYGSASRLTATVTAPLVAQPGTARITVQTKTGATSNVVTFNITPIRITSLNPNGVTAGSPGFPLTVNGEGFTPDSTVHWNGQGLPTSFVSPDRLTATVTAPLVVQPGSAQITVQTGTGATSNAVTFNITPIRISNLNPSGVTAGSPGFPLTVNGEGFTPDSTVLWNRQSLPTSFVSPTRLTATVTAPLVVQPGTAQITAQTGTGATSNAVPFNITPIRITSLNPSGVTAGSPDFPLTVNGEGFTRDSTVHWNGQGLPTSFVSPTRLTARVTAPLVIQPGTAQITVRTETGASSNAVPFTISGAPVEVINLNPTGVTAGSPDFTLSVQGEGFTLNSTVRWNGHNLQTSYVSASRLIARVPTPLVAQPGTAQITVRTETGAASNAVPFNITPIRITSLNPSGVTAGSPDFPLTVNGDGFTPNSTVRWNGQSLQTSFVSPSRLTATVTAPLVVQPGTAQITVWTETGATSNAVTFDITPIRITSLNPTGVTAGSPGLTLSVNGDGFTPNSTVRWNGQSLPTSFVSSSRLTATVTSPLVVQPGTAQITVRTETGATSNAVTFDITPIRITSLNPTGVTAGSPGFTLSVNGEGFTPNSTVRWNGQGLQTSYASASRLTARVTDSLVAQPSTAQITVRTEAGATSNAVTFDITPIRITSLNPTGVTAGSPEFTLTVIGEGFTPNSTLRWNGQSLQTSYASASRLTARVPAPLVAQPGAAQITVRMESGTTSNAANLVITPILVSSLSPSSVPARSPAFTLSVNGDGFNSGSAIRWGDSTLSTRIISGAQLEASVSEDLLVNPGTVAVTVWDQGVQSSSNSVMFTIAAPVLPAVTIHVPETVRPDEELDLQVTFGAEVGFPMTVEADLTFTPQHPIEMERNGSVRFTVSDSEDGRHVVLEPDPHRSDLTRISFAEHGIMLKTGTVAGRIDVQLRFWMSSGEGATEITPSPQPAVGTEVLGTDGPYITSACYTKGSTDLEVHASGYSPLRQISHANFWFEPSQGRNLGTTYLKIETARNTFTKWYATPESQEHGSSFAYVQRFTVRGDANDVSEVSVSLDDSQKESNRIDNLPRCDQSR